MELSHKERWCEEHGSTDGKLGGSSEDETSVVCVLAIAVVEVKQVDFITGTEAGVVVLLLADETEGLRVEIVITKSRLVSCEPVELSKSLIFAVFCIGVKNTWGEKGLANLCLSKNQKF